MAGTSTMTFGMQSQSFKCPSPDSGKGSEESWRDGAAHGMAVQGAVRNMDMINCFASFLPRAVPDQRKKLANTGRRIAALYYLEQMYKAEQLGADFAAQGLKRVDAMWRLAGSLCD